MFLQKIKTQIQSFHPTRSNTEALERNVIFDNDPSWLVVIRLGFRCGSPDIYVQDNAQYTIYYILEYIVYLPKYYYTYYVITRLIKQLFFEYVSK